MKLKLTYFLLLSSFFATVFSHAHSPIIIDTNSINKSVANQLIIYKDESNRTNVFDIKSLNDTVFKELKNEIETINFTNGLYWLKADLSNKTLKNTLFYIEVARPITNKVDLFIFREDTLSEQYYSGDDYPFDARVYPHRKNIYPVEIKPNESVEFILRLKSDGEVITLPFIIHTPNAFFKKEYFIHFTNGMFYGVIVIVTIIYFLFFFYLKEFTFLYYIVYVAFLGLMQFSLDGFSFEYFFPNNLYWANHFVLVSAALTVFFLLQYTKSFLKLSRYPQLFNLFNLFQLITLIFGGFSLINGSIYEMTFPLINGSSLIAIIIILWTIFYLYTKKENISLSFTSAQIVLLTGAIIFILGNFNLIGNPILSQNILKFTSAMEVVLLSISMSKRYRTLQQEKERIQDETLLVLRENNQLKDELNAKLEFEVQDRTQKLVKKNEELKQKNDEILSSIRYAQRIQKATLPTHEQINKLLGDAIVYYKPKEVVSGDFYFVENTTTSDNSTPLVLFAVVDCTGHGVPGAFMSLVGNSLLNQSLSQEHVNTTGEAMMFLNQGVNKILNQNKQNSVVRDGMDMILGAIDYKRMKLYFSGAKNSIFIIRSSVVPEIDENTKNPIYNDDRSLYINELKGDRHPIGAYLDGILLPFTTQTIQLHEGDIIFAFSDGFVDQFGGSRGKKYTSKRLKNFLLSIAHHPLDKQRELIEMEFLSWKGGREQIDDVCLMAIKV